MTLQGAQSFALQKLCGFSFCTPSTARMSTGFSRGSRTSPTNSPCAGIALPVAAKVLEFWILDFGLTCGAKRRSALGYFGVSKIDKDGQSGDS